MTHADESPPDTIPFDASRVPFDREVDLPSILTAWHQATDRLRQTHEVLRREVRRLTDELAVKNRELAHKNRLADLGQMASHVAHEVRNALVPLTLYLSLLRRRLEGEVDCEGILDKIESGFAALEGTVNDLLQFASDRDPVWHLLDVHRFLSETLESLEPQCASHGIQVLLDVAPGLMLRADRDLLRRAVINLVLNALDAMPDGGELDVSAVARRGGVEIEVADSGPGVNERQRPRLFEPFFTTKRGGTGLGLSVVERVAVAHGGSVRVANCPQGGAAFTIWIPRRALEAAA